MPSSNTSHSLNNSVLSTVVVSGTANGSQSSFIGSVTSSSNLQDTMSTLLNNAAASPNTSNPKPGGATSSAGQSTKPSSWASATSNGFRTGSQTGGASSISASAPDRPANNGFGLWNNSSSPSDNKGSKPTPSSNSSSSHSVAQTSVDNNTTSTTSSNRPSTWNNGPSNTTSYTTKPPSSSSSSSSHSVAQTFVDNNTTSTSTTSSNRPSTWNNGPSNTTSYTTKAASSYSSQVSSIVSQSTTAISTHIKVHSTPECQYGPSDEGLLHAVGSFVSSFLGDLSGARCSINPNTGPTTNHSSPASSTHSNTTVSYPSATSHTYSNPSNHSSSYSQPSHSHTRHHFATSTNYIFSSPLGHWPLDPSPLYAHHSSHYAPSTTQTSQTNSSAATRTKNGSPNTDDPPARVVSPSKAGTASGSEGGVRSSTVNSSDKFYEVVPTTSPTTVSRSSWASKSANQDDVYSSVQLTIDITTFESIFSTSSLFTITTGVSSGTTILSGIMETTEITTSATYTQSSTPNGSPPDKNNLGPLVGGIVGALVALILLGLVVCFVLRRKRRLRDQEYTAPLSPGPDTATIRDMHQFAATPVLVPAESPFADSTFIEHHATPSDLFYSVQGSDYESTEYYSDARQSVDSLFTSQIDLAASSHGFLPSDVAFPTLEEVGRAVEYPYINAPRRIIYSDTTSTERSTTSINSFSTFTPAATENPFIGEDHGAQTPTLDISSERPSLARTWSDQQRVAASWAAALAAASPVDPKDVSNQYMTNPFIDPSEDGHSINTTSTDDSLQTTLQARPVELHRNRLSSASSGIDIPSDPSQCGIAL